MSIQTNVDNFIKKLEDERKFAKNTITAYKNDLKMLNNFAQKNQTPIINLNQRDLILWVMNMRASKLGTRSIRRRLSAARRFYKYLIQKKICTQNPVVGITLPRASNPLPKVLSHKEVLHFLEPKDSTWEELRDVAIIEILYSSGLRLSELLSLNHASVDLNKGFANILGKGGRSRYSPIGTQAIKALQNYLNIKPHHRTQEGLFINRQGRRLTAAYVQQMMRSRSQIKKMPTRVHPHLLRHTAATHFLQSSHNLRIVQEYLGHKSVKSTQVYTHLDFAKLTKAYNKFHPHANAK